MSGRLGMASNLLAHHLKVLQAAGVVRRSRSEGDRRRTYVALELGDPAVLEVVGSRPMMPGAPRVVFVCTHNSARSHLARAAFERASGIPAASAGTAPASSVHPGAVDSAGRHGLDLSGHPTAHVADVLRPDDLVVAVCDNAYETSLGLDRTAVHWSVPDPVRTGTDAAFDAALAQILVRADRLGHALTDTQES
ncbi:ArsR family transcriptional regulator [Aquipuribacter hungaricus]|uniref:arsenate reductase/protein-tyrosine-phosphatase family protein n=1 Tax=Aquipuribacter hungaricus TaxID=545624 RepID=UPI003623B345